MSGTTRTGSLPQRPRGTHGLRPTCNLRADEMRRMKVTIGGFSSRRLARVRELLERHVDSGFLPRVGAGRLARPVAPGFAPGVVAALARHGEVHIEATGNLAFEGAGSQTPMAG